MNTPNTNEPCSLSTLQNQEKHRHASRRTVQALIALGLSATLALGSMPMAAAAWADSASSNTNSAATAQEAQSDSASGSNTAQGDSSQNGQEPPAKPDGDNGGNPPDKPDGESGQEPPSKPDGEQGGQGGAADGQGGQNGGAPGGGADTMTFDYQGTYSATVTADGAEKSSDGETVSATETDVNAALAENGGTLSLSNATLSKTGDDTNGDNCNFYGVNSIVTAVGEGSSATVEKSTLTSSAEGANGVFATNNASVTISDSSISTTANNSRGLDATYGGTITASNMDISTEGDHCAAVATDRGGGTVTVSDSTFATKGSGSPLIYSTGSISVSNATGTASGSQIAGMEGLNTIDISNSTLKSTITKATASDPIADGVIIYQSTSGDAEATTGSSAVFNATDSTLESAIQEGSMFYVTNTNAIVTLKNTVLDFDSSKAALLRVEGNDSNNWGTAGSNGATAAFVAYDETLSGDVSADTISSADVFLMEGTSYTGATSVTENTAQDAKTTESPLTMNVSADSTWTVTADSTLTNLNVAEGGQVVDSQGKAVSVVSADGTTLVEGESSVTVTVTGSYGTELDSIPTASSTDSADDASDDTGSDASSDASSAEQEGSGNWFADLWQSILSFFGL